tara:strand:- start:1046 stop:1489 length:444 start_codon:yes stop_codon:yes gene_type:complete
LKDLIKHEYFIKKALEEAQKAADKGEVPVGAVIVVENKIIARAHNLTQTLNDVTAHAEIMAITSAANFLNSKYLKECSLYVTLEPCMMCAGAIYWSQINQLVFGALDPKRGYSLHGNLLHPRTNVISGICGNESSRLLKDFFEKKRK